LAYSFANQTTKLNNENVAMKRIIITFTVIFCLAMPSLSQDNFTQVIKGRVLDQTTGVPLPGATVIVVNSDPIIGAVSDEKGFFRLEEVPIGRQSVKISFVGYYDRILKNLIVSSGKQVNLEITLEESVIEMKGVEIKARNEKVNAINKMATVSARTFTVEESEKYAGSRGDVARMAMNFAGVSGANDSRNDIIIRGNSPSGLLWKVDGVDVGNPNHFAQQGTTGGPVGMLNNNNLQNSDFFTGAFPAEYGNALSGVFDLKLKTGNAEKFEFLGQIGFNGFEAGIEGPIRRKNHSSFIANYRYSTLGLVKDLGADLGTGTGVPYYQDLTLNVIYPTRKGRLQFFGMTGTSNIAMLSDPDETSMYSWLKQDLYNGSDYLFSGLNYTHYHNNNLVSRHTLSYLYENGWTTIDVIEDDEEPKRYFEENSMQNRLTYTFNMSHKINSSISHEVGAVIDRIGYDIGSEVYREEFDDFLTVMHQELVLAEGVMNYKVFNQWLIKFNDELSISPGFHLMYFDLTEDFIPEPRIGLKWKTSDKGAINLGVGMHSRLQNLSTYFLQTEAKDGSYFETNIDLKPTRAVHYVASYDYRVNENLRLKVESYYQDLWDVPVEMEESSFSMLNTGASWGVSAIDSLVNKGSGTNYGLEFTLERFYNKGLYYLITASLFDSKYKGSDNIERNTAFNGNYVFNALVGKEFMLNEKSVLFVDLKTTYAGGRRYTPIDIAASELSDDSFFPTVYNDEKAFSEKFPDYFKLDAKVGYRVNGKKITQEWMIYVENLTNHKNVLMEGYDSGEKEVVRYYQQGAFPMMQYRILF
jgi:hypothetical protein